MFLPPPPMRRVADLCKAALAVSLLSAASPAAAQFVFYEEREEAEQTPTAPQMALMGTIPIYWGEAAGIDEMLSGAAEPHWARQVLERDFTLAPLDYLDAEALAGHDYLLLAQPRGLTGEENVALDAWVRAGGNLLLFADPLITAESRFPLGDRRRPQDTVLLSPILTRWGLDLQFDGAQDTDLQMREFAGFPLPVQMAGRLAPLMPGAACTLEAEGVVAWCRIGSGHALIVADAAVIDLAGPYEGAEAAFIRLLAHSMGNLGEEPADIDPIRVRSPGHGHYHNSPASEDTDQREPQR